MSVPSNKKTNEITIILTPNDTEFLREIKCALSSIDNYTLAKNLDRIKSTECSKK